MSQTSRHEVFARVAARVLSDCYSEHPLALKVVSEQIAIALDVDQIICQESISWLIDNRYLLQKRDGFDRDGGNSGAITMIYYRHLILSDLGFSILSKKISINTVGQELKDQTENAERSSNFGALGEFVGGLFGGAIKSIGS
jgi:hypothetical protein